jgi:hypothetical protein
MMIPLEATSVIGAIAGVGEIAKEVFAPQGANEPLARHTAREI